MNGWAFTVMTATAVLAVVGAIVVWAAKRLGARRLPAPLRPGKPLPSFSASNESGQAVKSDDLRGAPAVILFVRGNWCPFCNRQVRELTRWYRRINELGARLVLVTPRPLETTRRVADFFDFDFEFWLDESLSAGKALGLVQSGGVPDTHRREYGADTLWPAALVTDSDGIIRYASISKLLADRPKPERFVRTLESLREQSAGS